jgi:hypothetical protein
MTSLAALVAISVGSWIVVPGGSWSPSPEQIAEVRGQIGLFVKQHAAERRLQLPAWASYSFQYQGQSEGGRQIIFVNAFCIAPTEYAQSQFVLVFDGGPCFFQLKYDPRKKRFFQLTFNGVA